MSAQLESDDDWRSCGSARSSITSKLSLRTSGVDLEAVRRSLRQSADSNAGGVGPAQVSAFLQCNTAAAVAESLQLESLISLWEASRAAEHLQLHVSGLAHTWMGRQDAPCKLTASAVEPGKVGTSCPEKMLSLL